MAMDPEKLSVSLQSLVKAGKVSGMSFAPNGDAEVKIMVPKDSLKSEELRRTVTALTNHMM